MLSNRILIVLSGLVIAFFCTPLGQWARNILLMQFYYLPVNRIHLEIWLLAVITGLTAIAGVVLALYALAVLFFDSVGPIYEGDTGAAMFILCLCAYTFGVFSSPLPNTSLFEQVARPGWLILVLGLVPVVFIATAIVAEMCRKVDNYFRGLSGRMPAK